MSWVATAVIGSAVIGGISSYSSAKSASRASDRELDFAKQQYRDWYRAYGPIQERLSAYYNSLDPEQYAAEGIQELEQEFDRSMTLINEGMARRGLDDSGLAMALETDLAFDMARGRAEIRHTADEKVAAQQMGFLSVGLGNDKSNAYQDALANDANRKNKIAGYAADAFGQSLGNVATYALSGGFGSDGAGAGAEPIDHLR